MTSRKDYVATAAAIASVRDDVDRGYPDDAEARGWAHLALDSLSERLADYFATDNSNFDRRRFLAAAGREVSR